MKLVPWITPNARALLVTLRWSCLLSIHLLKTTQTGSEVYLQEMQEDSNNKATPQPQLDQQLQAVI